MHLRLGTLALAPAMLACATLQVEPAEAPSAQFAAPVSFVGAYDSRVQSGMVDTKRIETQYNYVATPGGGGMVYPSTTVVRTGEVEPNLMIRGVAEGFVSVSPGNVVRDLSGETPLDARGEMGLDWLARNRSTERFLVGVEVKDAHINLDAARSNFTLGMTATVFGLLSPLLLCTTAPCLLYLPFARTNADGSASATVRVYDRERGSVVHSVTVTEQVSTSTPGFHDAESVYTLLAAELARRLGQKAAAAASVATQRPPS
ncbi:MAG: hypothetical protein IT383_22950 [Deltaproteobacteria bacterium]|nr:hypothetical protein [Deltaproteobacteria bacterium]